MRPTVLALNGNSNDATSFYTSSGIFPYIEGVDFIYSDKVDWATLMRCQIVFIPRPYTQSMVSVCQYVKICKKALWLSLDDDHFNIPKTNPSYEVISNPIAIECHKECIRLATVVTVTTQALKDVVLEHCPEANVEIIANAVNDYLFDLTPSYHQRNRTILIRGGGSHEADIEAYKEPILQLIKDYPEYKWAMVGYCPKWLANSGIENDRLLVYDYTDLMKYFEILMELKPEIMIVPLEDTKFNRSKSNIAWIEGTIAGATVAAPIYLSEFDQPGVISLHKSVIEGLMILNSKGYDNEDFYIDSLGSLPKLSDTNELRKDIIERLSKKKYKFTIKNDNSPNKIATDPQFFNVCLTHGHTQDNKEYEKMHRNLVDWLVKKLDPKTVVEFGSGPGATVEYFHDLGVTAFGMEMNPEFIKYWDKRNPDLSSYIVQCDFIKDPVELEEVFDLGVSIEVFEHIKMKEVDWEKFIEKLSTQFKHFYFSSTPFRDKPSQDHFWGHCNIRTPKSWIKLFEENGWTFVENPKVLVGWDLIFRSKNAPFFEASSNYTDKQMLLDFSEE